MRADMSQNMCMDMGGHVCRHVYGGKYEHVECIEVCMDMCINMQRGQLDAVLRLCVDTCFDMCAGM